MGIRLRRKTSAEWTAENAVIPQWEMIMETDTGKTMVWDWINVSSNLWKYKNSFNYQEINKSFEDISWIHMNAVSSSYIATDWVYVYYQRRLKWWLSN